MRHFIDSDEKPPARLFRFEVAESVVEEMWEGGRWLPDPAMRISRMLVTGDGWYDEISAEKARALFPGSA